MDVFTMVVVACVAGETICSQARISEINFTTAEICESRVDDVANSMVKEFAQDVRLKGKEVTFEVTCMNRQQMRAKLGVIQTDM